MVEINPLSILAKIAEAADTVTAAKKTSSLAAKTPAATRGLLATPDLRALDQSAALKVARKQPHIISDASGQFVGAPRGVTSMAQLRALRRALRRAFDADVAAGAAGADWYPRARAWNVDVAGADPARQKLLSSEEALWSAQATPDTNLNFALQGHNAYEAGAPLDRVRTGQQARTYSTARDNDLAVPLGKKTGVYGQHLDPTQPFATTGTNDIWHARALGYVGEDGKPFSRALTKQEHRFMDYETMLAVDRANKKGLGGRTDWSAHEIQAAPWVAGKGRSLAAKGKLPLEEGVDKASLTYPDFEDKYTGFATHEQTPYVGSEHLPDLVKSDFAARKAYADDPRSSWADTQGRDVLYDALGVYQRPVQEARGFYTPPGGAPESSPARVSRPLVGLSKGAIDPASRSLLEAAEGTRAYFDAQGAGAAHAHIRNVPAGQMGSVFAPHSAPLTEEQLGRLQTLGAQYGVPDIVDTGQGATMTRFYPGEPPGGGETGKALKSGFAGDITSILGGRVGSGPQRSLVDSLYVPMHENATRQGSGEVTDALEVLLSKYPQAMRDKISASPAVRAKVLGNAQRDAEIAATTGQPLNEPMQTARAIFHKSGLQGLFDARKAGVILPSAFAAVLGEQGLSASQAPQAEQ